MRWTAVLAVWLVSACRPPASRPQPAPGVETHGRAQIVRGMGRSSDEWRAQNAHLVAMSPDGRWLVVVSNRMLLVELPSGDVRAELVEHAGSFDADQVAFSADSRRFAAEDPRRRCIAVWTLSPLTEERCIGIRRPSYARVALSPTGDSLVIRDNDGWLSRWEVADGSNTWQHGVESSTLGFLRWPRPDVIVTGDSSYLGTKTMYAIAAETGDERWHAVHEANRVLGTQGSAVVVVGPYLGPARVDLDTGDLRRLGGRGGELGAVLDDGTVVVVDAGGIARRWRLGGAGDGAFQLPPRPIALSAARDGTAAVITRDGLAFWDLLDGRPMRVGDVQAPIVALAAGPDRVVSASADGAVITRDRRGATIAARHLRAPSCQSVAIAPSLRRVACAASFENLNVPDDLAPPPAIQWLALDGDVGDGDGDGDGGAMPGSPGSTLVWASGDDRLFDGAYWIDRRTRLRSKATRSDHTPGFAPSTAQSFRATMAAALADQHMVVSGTEILSMSYASAMVPPSTLSIESGGLALISPFATTGTGEPAVEVLDRELVFTHLASSAEGRHFVAVSPGALHLWRFSSFGSSARLWTIEIDPPRAPQATSIWITAVAVAQQGTLVAVAEDRGVLVTVRDGATGAIVGTVDFLGLDVRVTASAFTGVRLFVGTSTGQVLEVSTAGPPTIRKPRSH